MEHWKIKMRQHTERQHTYMDVSLECKICLRLITDCLPPLFLWHVFPGDAQVTCPTELPGGIPMVSCNMSSCPASPLSCEFVLSSKLWWLSLFSYKHFRPVSTILMDRPKAIKYHREEGLRGMPAILIHLFYPFIKTQCCRWFLNTGMVCAFPESKSRDICGHSSCLPASLLPSFPNSCFPFPLDGGCACVWEMLSRWCVFCTGIRTWIQILQLCSQGFNSWAFYLHLLSVGLYTATPSFPFAF